MTDLDLSTPDASPLRLSADAEASALFRLPQELRDRIYSYILVSSHPIAWPTLRAARRHDLWPALLRVSQALYHESAPVLYTLNTLAFAHPSDANMFLWTAGTVDARTVTTLDLHITDNTVRLWSQYLSSTNPHRSLLHDYPCLRSLSITYRSAHWAHPDAPNLVAERFARWQSDPRVREICLSLEGKTPPGAEVSLLVVQSVPRREVQELARRYPAELGVVGAGGETRTRFGRMFCTDVALEMRPIDAMML